MKKNFFLSLCTAGIISADQLIKHAVRAVPEGYVFLRLPGLVELTHSTNTGAAFSLFSGNAGWLAMISVILLVVLGVFLYRSLALSPAAQIAFSCLIGGGIGNLIDRVLYGSVTDYIRLIPIRFPVFNLADIAITTSVSALLLMILIGRLEIRTGETHGSNH